MKAMIVPFARFIPASYQLGILRFHHGHQTTRNESGGFSGGHLRPCYTHQTMTVRKSACAYTHES